MKLSSLNGVVAAAGAIIFTSTAMLVLAPQPHPASPLVVPSRNETANWKTYRNDIMRLGGYGV